MNRIQSFPRNTLGRDIAVGDLHGHRTRLEDSLARIGFDRERDRLFCVGDLVDRGPESDRVVALVDEPWFHAVRGNHDLSVIAAFGPERDPDTDGLYRFELVCDAHEWMEALPAGEREATLARLLTLPYAIEVATDGGPVGLVHGEVPEAFADWPALRDAVSDEAGGRTLRHALCWERGLARRAAPVSGPPGADGEPTLPGAASVLHGHTPMADPPEGVFIGQLGNRYWIDTAGWVPADRGQSWRHPPRFTLVDLTAPWQPL